MRTSLSIPILLITLSLPGWLVYAFFQYRKYQVREEVKEQLLAGADPADLLELTFAREEAGRLLTWEDDREFEYRGQMYDVVAVFTEGDSIRYLCFHDRQETDLNRQLDQLVARTLGHDPGRKAASDQLSSFFKTLYCVANAAPAFPAPEKASTGYRYVLAGSAGIFPPPVPPPQGF